METSQIRRLMTCFILSLLAASCATHAPEIQCSIPTTIDLVCQHIGRDNSSGANALYCIDRLGNEFFTYIGSPT